MAGIQISSMAPHGHGSYYGQVTFVIDGGGRKWNGICGMEIGNALPSTASQN